MPTACQASLAPNQSRNKRCPADNLAKSELTQAPEQAGTRPHGARLHDPGIIGTRAFQSTSKEGGVIHMCSMKLPIYYPAAPFFHPPPGRNPIICLLLNPGFYRVTPLLSYSLNLAPGLTTTSRAARASEDAFVCSPLGKISLVPEFVLGVFWAPCRLLPSR